MLSIKATQLLHRFETKGLEAKRSLHLFKSIASIEATQSLQDEGV
jgi:hypothetical protein